MDRIHASTLSCGMPLVIEPIDGVGSVAISWMLPAGSARDDATRQGASAMWSELLFRGAGNLDSRAQADTLDGLGMNRSASVGTLYLPLSAVMLGSTLDDGLARLVDMVRAPMFDADAIEPARDLSLQSIESLADDPQQRAFLSARERYFPDPINRSGLGTTDGLTALTRDELVDGWAARARPGGAILSIAGDVDPARVTDRLESLLDGWSGDAPEVHPGEAPHRGTYHHIDDSSEQVQIVALHEAPPEPDENSLYERVVHAVLSGGMAARLFTEVREKRGLCYAVSASYVADRTHGRSQAYVGTTPERAQESLDVLASELHRINGDTGSGGGIEQAELDRALVGMKSGLIFSGESTGARAGALGLDQHRIGRPRPLDELLNAIDQITLDDVNGYLARRSIGSLTIVTLGSRALTPPQV